MAEPGRRSGMRGDPDVAVITGVGLALPAGVRSPVDLIGPEDGPAGPAKSPANGSENGGGAVDAPERAERVDPAARIGRKGLRYKDRATQLALVAGSDALCDAGLLPGGGRDAALCDAGSPANGGRDAALRDAGPPANGGPDAPRPEGGAAGRSSPGKLTVPPAKVAVVVSSNYGNLDSIAATVRTIAHEGGTRLISPMTGPCLSSNVIASEVAIRFGPRGPNLMVCNGPNSGLDALRWAVSLLGSGRADQVLVLGAEPDNEVVRSLVGSGDILDGAVGLVVERAGTAFDRGVPARARLGRYVRGGNPADCVRALAAAEPAPTGWYVPEGLAVPPDLLTGVARYDLARRWGGASGASGVLSAAAAVGRFATGAGGPVYAVTGGVDACAGLALWPGDG